ncbi:DUF1579 family protein [Nonomuraea sp. NPDC059194]|uniref:DUF1579 family protein n=1 Tax=Nonomuraea sp. NPDC059194 TaxID=3346764 RepID=UPI003673BD99
MGWSRPDRDRGGRRYGSRGGDGGRARGCPAARALSPPLELLVGTWKATKTNYVIGKDGRPVVSGDITVKVRWLTKTGNRYLQETTARLGGRPYHRIGVLGFSNIDKRHEWTTFDNVTPQAMTYRGEAVEGHPKVLSIPGQFTDPGMLGPEYVGKAIPMRTVITISPKGRHTLDMYFTPPGQQERLADRVVYTRRTD